LKCSEDPDIDQLSDIFRCICIREREDAQVPEEPSRPPVRIINAAGYLTRLGNSIMDPHVLRAMEEASGSFVELDQAQLAASRVIAAITGAEAGYVVGGAAAGLALAAAACIAGDDLDRIRRLPDTEGMSNEIILPEGHEIYYERFIRLAGARLTFVPDEAALTKAIGPDTVGIFYEASMPGPIPQASLASAGRAAGIPVVADAAVSVPPVRNLRAILADGTDLAVFTGSKAVRGPAGSGFVAGRGDLVRSVMLQHQDWDVAVELSKARDQWLWGTSPPFVMGMGRAFKVGKEDIAGLVAALQAYDQRDHDADRRDWSGRLSSIAAALSGLPGIDVRLREADDDCAVPLLYVAAATTSWPIERLAAELRTGDPAVWLSMSLFPEREVWIDPVNLRDGDDALLISAFEEALRRLG
jgi:L-seryl-tRNA(Ser) seleniumtransferase